MIRKSTFSGHFYPEQKEELVAALDAFTGSSKKKHQAKGLILPHAGYIYSGEVAGATVSRTMPKKTLLILGPNHTGRGKDFGLWPSGAWETPLGKVPIDEDIAAAILSKSRYIQADHEAHLWEHSIEVELPFFQRFFDNFSLVPIACKNASLNDYRLVANEITDVLDPLKNDVLIVASSDLTHYEPEESARRKDRLAISAMIDLDEEELLTTVDQYKISMCGTAPVAIALVCLKQLRSRKAQVVLYQTSAKTSGDLSAVVGYAGIIIS
jgi:MEMO1 family protein